MTTYDSPWKETFCDGAVELLFPTVYAGVDWQRGFEFLDTELREICGDPDAGKGIVDKLIKVWLKDGEEAWLLLHVEIQVQAEAEFPARMFKYNIAIRLRYNREVVSLAVLGDDRASWRPNEYRSERWGCEHVFRFPVVKLLDWQDRTEELRTSRNPVAHIVLAHLRTLESTRDPEQRRTYKSQVVRHLYELGFDAETIRRLYRIIDWLMTLPVDLQKIFRDDFHRFEEEKHMPYVTSTERLARQEGHDEGVEEGLKKTIKKLLEHRFPAENTLLNEVARIKDIEHLEKLVDSLIADATPEEIKRLVVGR